jgi:hypothetical protein
VRRWSVVSTALFLASNAAAAPAAPAPASASPERPVADAVDVLPGATCLDEQRLEAHVQMWLGSGKVPTVVRVFVQGDARRRQAVEFRIAREGAIRWRKFDPIPGDCTEAHAALGLAIALAIDEGALDQLTELSKPRRPRLVAFELAGGYDVVPGPSGGLKVGIEYGVLDWLFPRAEALVQHSRNNEIEGSSGRFDATLFAATLGFCTGGPLTDDVRIALCSSLIGGAVYSRGNGYRISSARTGEFFSGSTGVRLELRAGIPWVLDLDVVFPLRVPRFTVERPGSTDLVRNPPPAGVLIGIGPALAF